MFSATKRLRQQPAGSTNARTNHSVRQGVVDFVGRAINDVGAERLVFRLRPALVATAMMSMVTLARAEEPRSPKEPTPLLEPIELTQVADAFDTGDPIDVNLSLGYQYSSRSADILREAATASGTNPRGNEKIAQYSESTHRLLMRADIGVFHDLALVVRM